MSDKRTIRGRAHRLVLLHIKDRDEHGRPKRADILYDENVVNIQGGEEFLTAYVLDECVRKKAN